jgi:hypothetical protein
LPDGEVESLVELDVRSGAPDLVADLGARDYGAVLLDEQRQHLERLWWQRDTLAVPEKLGGIGVELEGSETKHGLGRSASLSERSWNAHAASNVGKCRTRTP